MKIVHLTDHLQPWMGYQETYLPREQIRAGHQVWVLTSNLYNPKASGIRKKREAGTGFQIEEGIPVYRLPVLFETPTVSGYVWMKGVRNLVEKLAPDVIHCHGALSFTAVQAALLNRSGFPVVFDTHMSSLNVFHSNESGLKKKTKTEVYILFARLISLLIPKNRLHLVAIGEPEQDFICKIYNFHPRDIPIIRLGADQEKFRFNPVERARIRQQLGISEDDIVIGHAGSIIPSKGIETLIKSCRYLDDIKNICIFLVGNLTRNYRELLSNLAFDAGWGDRLCFNEFVPTDQLPGYLSAMDIAVWPGDITITALEAMSVGLPLVTCRTAYTEFMVERFNAGFLLERGSELALSSILRDLIQNSEERKVLGRNARKAVEEEYNWTNVANQFVELYQS